MNTVAQPNDDSRFDDAEHDVDLEALEEAANRGEPWRYPTKPGEESDSSMPNPLVLRVTGVSTGTIQGDEVKFLNGVDARGKKWSRILGSKSLRELFLDGSISEWNDAQQAFAEVARVGEVRPGERAVIRFRGFTTIKSGPYKGKEIPDLKAERPDWQTAQDTPADGTDEDVPF